EYKNYAVFGFNLQNLYMKIRNILSALFVLSCLTSSTQQISSPWQWLNPKPAGYLNTKVRFTDDSIGFIFNDNGDLISTTDGGVSWSIQKKFSNAKVFDIHDSTGIIAGYTNEINISIDNGITWHKSVVGNSQIPYFKFVQVVSRDTLFALNSNNSTLYQSTDKGTTWTAVLTNSLLNSPSSFYFINSKIGFLCHSSIYKTIDGGNTWQPVNTNNSSPVLATRFLNENFGIVTLENSDMLKTTDGGISWTPINFPYRAYDLFFINEDTIFASCEQAKIYRSTNGGTSWSIVSPPSPNAGFWFFSIDFIDQNKGFVVGTSGKILSTQDGGGTWRQYSISHTEITSFSVPSSEIIYATDWWNVYKSTDTGQTWDSTNLSLSEGNKRFTHMWFRNKDTGFVVTKNNVTFYKTYNGGQTWEEYNPLPSTFGSVLAMSFVNDSIGYVCLNNSTAGTNFRTTDGGETWTFVSNAFIFFEQLDFITEQKGFGVAGHQVFLTIDSAKTFQVVLNNDNFSFNGLHFINGDTGYVYGNSGIVKRTLDGGVSWSDIKLPYGHFNGGYFFNALVGYLSGEAFNGSIIKTYDGGVTWHREFNLNLDRMVSFDKDTMMYIAGKGGSVLRQKVSGYGLDSILFKNITPCSADFSAYVSVAFGTINNIRLEYGQSGFTNITSLSPSSVSDSTVKVTSTLQNLE
ncbi:MAG TPA: YCF48-related protein, partial [Mangrovimonas sp.]|nr:YCF48-related protein [Mangrovimonas sp.]